MYAVAGLKVLKVCIYKMSEVGVFVVHVQVGRVGIMALSGSARQVPGSLPRRTGRGQ